VSLITSNIKIRIDELASALAMLNHFIGEKSFKTAEPMIQVNVRRIANYGSTLSNSVNTVVASINGCYINIDNQIFIVRLLKEIDDFLGEFKAIFGSTSL
jgi:hypothetical protein